MAEEVKVAILEQKLEDLKDIIVKIDDAIEKMSEVNSNVTKMLSPSRSRELRNKKKVTTYSILKLTNSVIKLTGIMTHLCQEYKR
jgi:hypothetical protein